LVGEIRQFYDGLIVLSGSIANGSAVLAAQAMGADLAYMGTRFIATAEANASEGYKHGITEASASDVVYTNLFTGCMAITCVRASSRPVWILTTYLWRINRK